MATNKISSKNDQKDAQCSLCKGPFSLGFNIIEFQKAYTFEPDTPVGPRAFEKVLCGRFFEWVGH